jgi:hypothetical protein
MFFLQISRAALGSVIQEAETASLCSHYLEWLNHGEQRCTGVEELTSLIRRAKLQAMELKAHVADYLPSSGLLPNGHTLPIHTYLVANNVLAFSHPALGR